MVLKGKREKIEDIYVYIWLLNVKTFCKIIEENFDW